MIIQRLETIAIISPGTTTSSTVGTITAIAITESILALKIWHLYTANE